LLFDCFLLILSLTNSPSWLSSYYSLIILAQNANVYTYNNDSNHHISPARFISTVNWQAADTCTCRMCECMQNTLHTHFAVLMGASVAPSQDFDSYRKDIRSWRSHRILWVVVPTRRWYRIHKLHTVHSPLLKGVIFCVILEWYFLQTIAESNSCYWKTIGFISFLLIFSQRKKTLDTKKFSISCW